MASVIHIAEIAALLLVAYVIGWAVGYLGRRLTARQPAVVIPAERLAAVMGLPADDALVKTPVIAPVAATPLPGAQELPAASLSAIDELARMPLDQPAVAAPAPIGPEHSLAQIAGTPPARAVKPTLAPLEPTPALPASHPGEAWTGEIKGHPPVQHAALQLEPALAAAPESPEPVVEPAPAEPAATPPAEPLANSDLGEDAAMRAIEGGWSRRHARALPDAPELSDLGAAVAKAEAAVGRVLAQGLAEDEPLPAEAKPTGLSRPRPGEHDDLKAITGLSPLDELTLHNLGVFHFDQIAAWSAEEVLWMENHVFAHDRIGGEDWQTQARALAEGRESARATI